MSKVIYFVFISTIILPYVEGYIYMSRLRMNLMNSILINTKIKNDFKWLDHDEAMLLTSFWQKELINSQTSHIDDSVQDVDMLFRDINKENNNLINMKYRLICNRENNDKYLIWRPKIQLFLQGVYDMLHNTDNNTRHTLLYPSFRESIFLILISCDKREDGVKVINLVKSPFWTDDNYNSDELLKGSMKKYFVSYLKYKSIEYKSIEYNSIKYE